MGEKCPKNLTASVRFYGDRTGTVRIWRFSHRMAPVTPNRSIYDWGITGNGHGHCKGNCANWQIMQSCTTHAIIPCGAVSAYNSVETRLVLGINALALHSTYSVLPTSKVSIADDNYLLPLPPLRLPDSLLLPCIAQQCPSIPWLTSCDGGSLE